MYGPDHVRGCLLNHLLCLLRDRHNDSPPRDRIFHFLRLKGKTYFEHLVDGSVVQIQRHGLRGLEYGSLHDDTETGLFFDSVEDLCHRDVLAGKGDALREASGAELYGTNEDEDRC